MSVSFIHQAISTEVLIMRTNIYCVPKSSTFLLVEIPFYLDPFRSLVPLYISN